MKKKRVRKLCKERDREWEKERGNRQGDNIYIYIIFVKKICLRERTHEIKT